MKTVSLKAIKSLTALLCCLYFAPAGLWAYQNPKKADGKTKPAAIAVDTAAIARLKYLTQSQYFITYKDSMEIQAKAAALKDVFKAYFLDLNTNIENKNTEYLTKNIYSLIEHCASDSISVKSELSYGNDIVNPNDKLPLKRYLLAYHDKKNARADFSIKMDSFRISDVYLDTVKKEWYLTIAYVSIIKGLKKPKHRRAVVSLKHKGKDWDLKISEIGDYLQSEKELKPFKVYVKPKQPFIAFENLFTTQTYWYDSAFYNLSCRTNLDSGQTLRLEAIDTLTNETFVLEDFVQGKNTSSGDTVNMKMRFPKPAVQAFTYKPRHILKVSSVLNPGLFEVAEAVQHFSKTIDVGKINDIDETEYFFRTDRDTVFSDSKKPQTINVFINNFINNQRKTATDSFVLYLYQGDNPLDSLSDKAGDRYHKYLYRTFDHNKNNVIKQYKKSNWWFTSEHLERNDNYTIKAVDSRNPNFFGVSDTFSIMTKKEYKKLQKKRKEAEKEEPIKYFVAFEKLPKQYQYADTLFDKKNILKRQIQVSNAILFSAKNWAGLLNKRAFLGRVFISSIISFILSWL